MTKKLFFLLLWSIFGLAVWAQPQNYHALMSQAKSYSQEKEYEKSNACYEQVIAELENSEYASLVPSVRNGIAINNLHMGVAALKEKDYPTSKDYLEKAIKNAKPDSKTFYMAHSWMGQWNSIQSLNIRSARINFDQALKFSLEAERYFDLAKAPDKRLKEQVSRASILQELSRNDDAEILLKQIMAECAGVSERDIILGKAAFELGRIEVLSERFLLGIQHLEQCYDLCRTSSESKTWARLAAEKLSVLYTSNIPDNDKAALWKQRAEELESQTAK